MGWSDKYKRSIDCNNPKGFSQKAHCAGRKIRKENMKLSELKDTIRDLIQERSVNAISKAQQKNREDIARTLELYKKAKGGNKSYNEKNLIKALKKLGQDKKKLEKEMDDKISSLYKNADYKGPIDESAEDAGRGVIPGAVKMKLQKAMDVLGGKKLNYMQKIKVLGKVIDSLGIDKKDLQRISQRIKSKLNEGPSTQEFKIAAMAIKKQAKFRNVSPEQAIQDQLNALKLLQRYIKKGDVKKYTGMNLSEVEAKTLNEVNTNFYYLNRNYEKVLGEISHDLYYEIDRVIGDDVYEKVSKKFQDEFTELAFYHPRHDKWHPKDKAKIVEKELDKMVSTINKEMSKKTKKLLDELKKSALSIKKHIKISLQNK